MADEQEQENEQDIKVQQVALAERLQLKWLKRMDYLFDTGEITSTDLATLARFLSQNGWTLDPSRLPRGLRDKIGDKIPDLDKDDGWGIRGVV